MGGLPVLSAAQWETLFCHGHRCGLRREGPAEGFRCFHLITKLRPTANSIAILACALALASGSLPPHLEVQPPHA
jgi:hypothetical protein